MRRNANLNAWLVRMSGPLAGQRHLIRGPTMRLGRSPENDIVVDDSPVVSAHHLEIRQQGISYELHDLESTNGTYVNGERVTQTILPDPCTIRLGSDGPQLSFLLEVPAPVELQQTLVASAMPPSPAGGAPDASMDSEHEELLSAAVARARLARRKGVTDQTIVLMRQVLNTALQRTSRKFQKVIAVLVLVLLGTISYGAWRIQSLKREKRNIDAQIQQIEDRLAKAAANPAETDRLLDQLDKFQDEGRALESNLLYRVGARQHEELIKREIRSLMAEFGAETYSVPPEFLQEVNRFIQQYQGPNRRHITLALGQARPNMEAMQQIFQENNLPPDLSYMVLVESALTGDTTSPAGAVGLWQFTPATAKQYGLKVGKGPDERLDARKATRAACLYIRDLILDFGAGSSVMLALAAYNLGPAKVKHAVRKVSDPIKQRNFWYLYRVRALPMETREYVPKVIAAMIVGRNPERFGF